jgi:hypothetical protein
LNNNEQQKYRIVAPRQGIAWLVQSLTLMRMQPGRLLLMVVLLQLIMGLTQIPVIGFLLILSVPALTAGLLQAFHVTAQGNRPAPSLLFVPLTSRGHTGRFFGMGALMFLVGIISVSLLMPAESALLDPELLTRIEQGDVEALSALDMESLRGMVFAFIIGLAISGTLSFMTIPLVWFSDRKLGAALSEGLKALFANWKPFLVLSLCLAGVLFPVSLVAGILFAVASSAGAFSLLVMAVVMLLVLAFQLLLFGTQYCAFRDIFRFETGPAPSEPEDESQLVA